MREVITVAILGMALVSFMGIVINYNSPPRNVACTIDVQHSDHVATYVGKGLNYDY